MSDLRVVTWNQNGWRGGQETQRAALLERQGVDLLCAQELNHARFRALLAALGGAWWGVFSLTACDGLPAPASYWGVAVFGRCGVVERNGDADVIGDPRDEGGRGLFWRRTVAVPVVAQGVSFTAASVHVRPWAVVGEQKLEFVQRLGQWLTIGPRPLLLGVDANSPRVDDDGAEHYRGVEAAVWGPTPTHGLRDAWRTAGQGLSPTYVLRSGRGVRFDHLWLSDRLSARTCTHVLEWRPPWWCASGPVSSAGVAWRRRAATA